MNYNKLINNKMKLAKEGLILFETRFRKYLLDNAHIILIPEYQKEYLEYVLNNIDLIFIVNKYDYVCLGINERFCVDTKTLDSRINIELITDKESRILLELSNIYLFNNNVSIIAFNSLNYRSCYNQFDVGDRILYGILNITPYSKHIAQYKLGREILFGLTNNTDILAKGLYDVEKNGVWATDETKFYFEIDDYSNGSDLVVRVYFYRVLNFHQKVLVEVNNRKLGEWHIRTSELEFAIPAEYLDDFKLSIRFQWPLASYVEGDMRKLSVMLNKMVIMKHTG